MFYDFFFFPQLFLCPELISIVFTLLTLPCSPSFWTTFQRQELRFQGELRLGMQTGGHVCCSGASGCAEAQRFARRPDEQCAEACY